MPFNGGSPIVFAMRLPTEVAFALGSVNVYWQGILMAAAMFSVILFTWVMCKQKALPGDTPVDLCLVMLPCAIVGARIWYVLSHYELYTNSFLQVLRFWDGGLTIYGAAIFAALGLFVYSLKAKIALSRLLDALAPGLVFGLALLVWGDFFSQTGYGPEITDAKAMWFPFAVLIEKSDTVHYAAFFYEFVWLVLVFALDWFCLRKRLVRDGSLFLFSMLLYCAGHAAFNLLRAASVPMSSGEVFQTPLLISIFLAVFAGILLILRYKQPRMNHAGDTQAGTPKGKAFQPVQEMEPHSFGGEEPAGKKTLCHTNVDPERPDQNGAAPVGAEGQNGAASKNEPGCAPPVTNVQEETAGSPGNAITGESPHQNS